MAPSIALCIQKANEWAEILDDMNVWDYGNRKPWPLEIEGDVGFPSLCRMGVHFI